MALHQRRESVGRTRFLLALSLSTVTALGVAAPLALRAVNAEANLTSSPYSDGTNPSADEFANDLLGTPSDRSLRSGAGGIGGIEAQTPAKGQAQTTKSESTDAPAETDQPSEEPVLTNPGEEPPPTEEPVEPPVEETTTTSVTEPPVTEPPTTDTTAPTDTTTPETTTPTTDPDDTTSTTSNGSSTTSSSIPVEDSATTSSSTSTTVTGPTP